MKGLFVSMLIILSVNAFGQYGFTPDSTVKSTRTISELKFSGDYLIASRTSKLLSWTFAIIGSGVYLMNNSINNKPDQTLNFTSGALMLCSVVFEVRSVIMIGKAGKAMQEERQNKDKKALTFYANPQSAGVQLTF